MVDEPESSSKECRDDRDVETQQSRDLRSVRPPNDVIYNSAVSDIPSLPLFVDAWNFKIFADPLLLILAPNEVRLRVRARFGELGGFRGGCGTVFFYPCKNVSFLIIVLLLLFAPLFKLLRLDFLLSVAWRVKCLSLSTDGLKTPLWDLNVTRHHGTGLAFFFFIIRAAFKLRIRHSGCKFFRKFTSAQQAVTIGVFREFGAWAVRCFILYLCEEAEAQSHEKD